MSNKTTTKFTEEKCITRFKTEDVDSVYDKIKQKGKFIFVTSSLSNYQKLIDYAQKLGLKSQIIAKKKLFFEELILVESIKV